MLLSVEHLRDFDLEGKDGKVGAIDDILFDDQSWRARYLVAGSGGWLSGRQTLIPPSELESADVEDETFNVGLTKDQVMASPPITSDRPVSRQQEAELHRHFGWEPYWAGGPLFGPPTQLRDAERRNYRTDANAPADSTSDLGDDPNLRSCHTVHGYRIEAVDGVVGHVDDFLLDNKTWQVKYLIIDTGKWLPGKKVIIASDWIKDINWAQSTVLLPMSRQAIKDSPTAEDVRKPDPDFEKRLQAHYSEAVAQ